jgi:hypothetical protein
VRVKGQFGGHQQLGRAADQLAVLVAEHLLQPQVGQRERAVDVCQRYPPSMPASSWSARAGKPRSAGGSTGTHTYNDSTDGPRARTARSYCTSASVIMPSPSLAGSALRPAWRGRLGEKQQFVSAPGRLFSVPVLRLGHRPALKTAGQHLDGFNERLHLRLKPVHAFLNGRLAGTAGRWFP